MTERCLEVEKALLVVQHPEKVSGFQRFFKTGPGESAEGDVFIGISVPDLRKVVRKFSDLSLVELAVFLTSPVHEKRLLALLIMVGQFKRGDEGLRGELHAFYLAHLRFINNWDLVDSSAEHLVGGFLFGKSMDLLFRLAQSADLWERRVAMIATFYEIRKGRFETALGIAHVLRNDSHDLIQKAVGWMLREIGKRDLVAEEAFLDQYALELPRTMLRYAIEKFPEERRRYYMRRV